MSHRDDRPGSDGAASSRDTHERTGPRSVRGAGICLSDVAPPRTETVIDTMTNRPQVGRPCPTPDKVATLANRLPNWTLLVFTVGIVIAGTVQAQAVIAVTPTPATPPATPVAAPTAEGSVQPLAVPLSGAAATIPGGLTKPATPSAIPTKPSGVDLTVAAKGSSAGDPGEPTGGERSDFGLLDSVLGETPATAGIVAPTPVPGTVPSNGDEIQLPPAAPMLTGSDAATETPAAPTPGTAPTPATAPRELPAVPTSPLGEPSIRIVEPTASIPSTIPNMLGPDNAPLLTPGTPESAVAPETVKDTTESGGLVHAVPLPGPRSTPASQPWQGSAAPVSELPATQLPATIVPRQNTFNLTDSASTPAGGPSGTNAASTSISASGGTSAPLSARITDSLLDPTMRSLRDRIRAVAEFHRQRPENAATRSPWGVMHAFLPYGVEAEVTVGDRRMNAIGYCCWNGTCRGMSLFFIDPKGQLGARVGPGYQGHEGQFLAMLAQCRIDPNYEIRIEQNRRTIHDLIAYEQSTCKPKTELTFKLIGLAHYVGTDASWSNETGVWNVERLLAEEMSQPVNGVALRRDASVDGNCVRGAATGTGRQTPHRRVRASQAIYCRLPPLYIVSSKSRWHV